MSESATERIVFVVIENAYGAFSRPDSIWSNREDAIERARELAGGAEFDEKESDAWMMEGHAKKGCSGFEVYEYELQPEADQHE